MRRFHTVWLPRLVGALAALAAATVGARAADTIFVTIDFAEVLKFDRPVGTVVLGNPGIATATIGDNHTLVLTGNAAGTTNLIVLDEAGKELSNAIVRVGSHGRRLVTLLSVYPSGIKRQTYSCTPQCEPTAMSKDASEPHQPTAGARAELEKTEAAPSAQKQPDETPGL
jgi:putative type II/III system pilus formation protein